MVLDRVEIIRDDEVTIADSARRLSESYDFVVTSGGIGPTHVGENQISKREWDFTGHVS